MCSIVVPGMKSRKKGAIVNIGSGSATYLPSYPLYAVYGATKVSIHAPSNALSHSVGMCWHVQLIQSLQKAWAGLPEFDSRV